MKKVMLFTLFLCFFFVQSNAQETFKNNQINIFLDCESCDLIYIRQELSQVNYVRRLENTDVQIRSTKLKNGSGGYRHNLLFFGHNRFQGHDQELFFIQNQDMSYDEFRQGILNVLKSGLVPYISHISPMNEIEITFSDSLNAESWNATKWKNWSALVGGDIDFDHSTHSSKRWELDPRISISKETPEEQFGLQYYLNYRKTTQQSGSESSSKNHQMYAYYAKALAPKWSIGGSMNAGIWNVNDVSNKNLNLRPMVEYSIWPYSVFHKKRLTLRYATTINQDLKFTGHGPEVRLAFLKKWGGISANYSLHHNIIPNGIDRLSTRFSGVAWFRISKGFYVSTTANLFGILRVKKHLNPTTSTRFGISFNYVLGDIYNNVVNPRLGF